MNHLTSSQLDQVQVSRTSDGYRFLREANQWIDGELTFESDVTGYPIDDGESASTARSACPSRCAAIASRAAYCAAVPTLVPHDAGPWCPPGRHTHCTCDLCW